MSETTPRDTTVEIDHNKAVLLLKLAKLRFDDDLSQYRRDPTEIPEYDVDEALDTLEDVADTLVDEQ